MYFQWLKKDQTEVIADLFSIESYVRVNQTIEKEVPAGLLLLCSAKESHVDLERHKGVPNSK